MRKLFYLVILMALAGSSCQLSESVYPAANGKSKEVEIQIATSRESTRGLTRTPVEDPGNANERNIASLDLLVFKKSTGEYLYRREAHKLGGAANTYRALLVESADELTIHLLANCRAQLLVWEARSDKGTSWEAIHGQLVDETPWRLVNSSAFEPLPMWGTVDATLSDDSSPTKMGPVLMLRSVASVDVYVEETAKTSKFILTDLYVYYAPNKGYLGGRQVSPATDPKQYMIPTGMTTSVKNTSGQMLHANKVEDLMLVENSQQVDYRGIAYQMYLYDNSHVKTGDNNARPSRAIIAGYYDQPTVESGETRVKSYYPIDIVYSDGKYRPVIRNWKYEFKVNSVSGPGSPSLEEAAEAANTDLNVDIISWNKEDVEIGVKGHYYVTIERKISYLWRYARSEDKLSLTYRILDDDPDTFEISFLDNDNGPQTDLTVAGGVGIQNDYFEVTMKQQRESDGSGGRIDFTVTAKENYTTGHSQQSLKVQFRNLVFYVEIIQLDADESDWNWGGEIPKEA
ncbi:hypothetical protein LJB87_00605 [Alistipes sp. OttesenSCG-928-L06]|nr:hypothetical protein [Alistipes sp. OttesenSCG-928-L06]